MRKARKSKRAQAHCLYVLEEGEEEDSCFTEADFAGLEVLELKSPFNRFSKILLGETNNAPTLENSDNHKKNSVCPKIVFIICFTTSLAIFAVAMFLVTSGTEMKSKFDSFFNSFVQKSILKESNEQTKPSTDKIIHETKSFPSEREEWKFLSEKPKMVDILGTGSSFFPLVFSECLGKRKENDKLDIEFLTETSFCERPRRWKQNQRAQIFIIVRNPLARSVQSFIEKQNRKSSKYDKKISHMNISSYIQNYVHEHNFLTRVITCKFEGNLYGNDLKHAKEFLDSNSVAVGVFPNHAGLVRNFQTHLKLNMSDSMQKCVDELLQNAWKSCNENAMHLLLSDNSDMLREANEYDIQLFMHILEKDIKGI